MREDEDVFQEDGTLHSVPSPIPPGEVMRLAYEVKHLSTGKVFPSSALFRNRHAFTRCLEKWNRQGTGVWEYRAVESKEDICES